MRFHIDFNKIVVVGKAGWLPLIQQAQMITIQKGNFAGLESTIKKVLLRNPGKKVFVCGEMVPIAINMHSDEVEGLNLILVDNDHGPPSFVQNSETKEIMPFQEFGFEWTPTTKQDCQVWYLGLHDNKLQSVSEEQLKQYRLLTLYAPDDDYWNFNERPVSFSYPFTVEGETEECDLAVDYGYTVKPSTCADPVLLHKKARVFVFKRHDDILSEEHVPSVKEAMVQGSRAATAKYNRLKEAITTPKEVLENIKVVRVFPSNVLDLCPFFKEAASEFKLHTGEFYKAKISPNYIVLEPLRRSRRVAVRQGRVVDLGQETERVAAKRSRDVNLEREIAALVLSDDNPGTSSSPPRKRRRVV